jgi:hypothetical protein
MDTEAETSTEYPWVAELRAAGIDVRTGTGHLNRVPDDSFSPPPGFRPGILWRIRGMLRRWKRGTPRLHRPSSSKRHATVP